jgi:hypothetical protein
VERSQIIGYPNLRQVEELRWEGELDDNVDWEELRRLRILHIHSPDWFEMPKRHAFSYLSTIIIEDPHRFLSILEQLSTTFNESRVLDTLVLADIGLQSALDALIAVPNFHARRLCLSSRHFRYYERRPPWNWMEFTEETWHVLRAVIIAARKIIQLTNERKMKVKLLDAQMVLIWNEATRQNQGQLIGQLVDD